jgi:hypothetical protein
MQEAPTDDGLGKKKVNEKLRIIYLFIAIV